MCLREKESLSLKKEMGEHDEVEGKIEVLTQTDAPLHVELSPFVSPLNYMRVALLPKWTQRLRECVRECEEDRRIDGCIDMRNFVLECEADRKRDRQTQLLPEGSL